MNRTDYIYASVFRLYNYLFKGLLNHALMYSCFGHVHLEACPQAIYIFSQQSAVGSPEVHVAPLPNDTQVKLFLKTFTLIL